MIGVYLVSKGIKRERIEIDETKPLGEEIKRHYPNAARVVRQDGTTLGPADAALPLDQTLRENGIKEGETIFVGSTE